MFKKILIFLINVYQKTLSPDHGPLRHLFRNPTCRFHPTCSQYAKEALQKYGVKKGSWLALKRIGRCHPFNPGGVDEP